MANTDDEELTGSEKAYRAQALITDINVGNYDDPKIPRLQDKAINVLDDLAVELRVLEEEK